MLFFLYGKDSFRSKEKLNELKNMFLKNNPSSGLFVFDFSEKNVSENMLLEALSSGGLFSAKKLVVSLDFLKNVPVENQKNLLENLKKKTSLAGDSDLTLIFHENDQPKKTTSFFKYLSTNAKKQEFATLDNRGTEKWISDYLKATAPAVSFSPKSMAMFTSYVGNNDLYLLKNELEKLINFKTQGTISEADIDLLVKSQTESTVFNAIESLLNLDKKTTLRLLHEQLQKGEDPFYLLSMYAYQLRTMLKISAAMENGNMNPHDIAKETAVHPFVVQKALPQLRKHSTKNLKDIYKKLEEIDIAAKTGKDNIPSLLDRFIASL